MSKLNRPHFHVWKLAKGDRAYFKLVRPFHTRQNARKYAIRQQMAPDRFQKQGVSIDTPLIFSGYYYANMKWLKGETLIAYDMGKAPIEYEPKISNREVW